MATTAYGKTGGTLAPIETGNKPYGGGTPVLPKATRGERYNPRVQSPLHNKIATARMARGGAGSATGKNRRLIGLKGSYRP